MRERGEGMRRPQTPLVSNILYRTFNLRYSYVVVTKRRAADLNDLAGRTRGDAFFAAAAGMPNYEVLPSTCRAASGHAPWAPRYDFS